MDSQVEDHLKKLRSGFANLEQKTIRISGIKEKKNWNDQLFEKTYGMNKLATIDDTQVKGLISLWTKYYYSTNVGVINVGEILYWALSCLPQGLIQTKEISYSKQGEEAVHLAEFLKPKSSQGEGFPVKIPSDQEESFPKNNDLARVDTEETDEPIDRPIISARDWIENLGDDISSSRALVAYQAIVMMRLLTKTKESVSRYFSNRFTDTFKQLFPSVNVPGSIPPPSAEFMSVVAANIQRGTKEGIYLLTCLINAYLVGSKSAQSQHICNILEAGCLLHTRGNGMGLLTLYFAVMDQWNLEFGELMELIVSTKILRSLDLIYEHIKTYTDKDEKTWWWARLIDDSYFSQLTIKNNLLCSVRLASILSSKQEGIFSIVSLSHVPEKMKMRADEMAVSILNIINDGEEDQYLGKIQLNNKKQGIPDLEEFL